MIGSVDRTIAPERSEVDVIHAKQADIRYLDNGIAVHGLNSGTQEIVKIEFIFKAGSWYQQKIYQAFATNKMLFEGSKQYSGQQIAEKLDFYGAFVESSSDRDNAYVVVYALNKYLKEVLEIVAEVMMNPSTPEKEFNTLIAKKSQDFQVNSQKVSFISRNNFGGLLYGSNHPYGLKLSEDVFDSIRLQDVRDYSAQRYHGDNVEIILAGKISDIHYELLNQFFGVPSWKSRVSENGNSNFSHDIITTDQQKHFIEKADAVQSSIRIGKPMFTKTHSDYFGMQVLNSLLGGYFGSRLMSNIREDKGYTYGIGSVLASFQNQGIFFISTEVGADVCEAALKEIYSEIELMRTELVDEEELEAVRSYMLGVFLRSMDGPFSQSERYKSLLEFGLDNTYYSAYIDKIKTIQTTEIRDLAQRYLDSKTLIELVVGKK